MELSPLVVQHLANKRLWTNETDKLLGQAIALRIDQTLRLKRTKVNGAERRKGVSLWTLV